MKAYIDELLALVLERNPALLEGLPRIQLRGTQPELFTAASLPEVSWRRGEGGGEGGRGGVGPVDGGWMK